jgi:CheY-like chemotaxis protein/quercetin dioxygenase-like cupin family protein
VQASDKQIRIVLADDMPEIMDAVAKRLEPDCTVVAKCADGAALVECVAEYAPDLVITDISMPKLSGIEALRRLRHKGVRTPAIILTVHQDEDLIKEAFSLGVQGFVLKRRLITDLHLAVRAALAGKTFVSNESGAVEKAVVNPGPRAVNEDGARAQIPGDVLLDRNGLFIGRSEEMQWRDMDASGCEKKVLFEDDREKSQTAIVRMQAGTHFPRHRHGGPEEVFLLEGDLVIEGHPMKPGDYCRAEGGTVHQGSFTKSGCVFLLRSSRNDVILNDKSS